MHTRGSRDNLTTDIGYGQEPREIQAKPRVTSEDKKLNEQENPIPKNIKRTNKRSSKLRTINILRKMSEDVTFKKQDKAAN